MLSMSDDQRRLIGTHAPEEPFPDDSPGRKLIPALPLVVVPGDYSVTESSLGVAEQIARKIKDACSE